MISRTEIWVLRVTQDNSLAGWIAATTLPTLCAELDALGYHDAATELEMIETGIRKRFEFTVTGRTYEILATSLLHRGER